MNELKYFNTGNKKIDTYRKYNTQGLLIANYDIKENGKKYISPDLLMSYLLNKMDLNLSGYYKFLGSTINNLASYNREITCDYGGKIQKLNDNTSQAKQIYSLREQLQYMMFIK